MIHNITLDLYYIILIHYIILVILIQKYFEFFSEIK